MARILTLIIVFLVLVAPVPSAADEACDVMAATADAWHELANALDEVGDAVLSDQDAAELDELFGEIVPLTDEIVWALRGGADPTQIALADELSFGLESLGGAESAFDAVAAMDSIVEALDAIVDDCDEVIEAVPAGGGRLWIAYEQPDDPALAALAGFVQQSQHFDILGALISETLILPNDLPAAFTNCGQANAFYDPNLGQVTMCWEFLSLFAEIFQALPPAELGQAVLDTGGFFFLHEVGHALVHQLEIPITGREEDSVDNLAAIVLLHADGPEALVAALQNFAVLAAMESENQLAFWDEHSLSAQRLYDLACLIFGSDPQSQAGLVGPGLLPEERAGRCPAEFEQKNRAWGELLAPYFVEP